MKIISCIKEKVKYDGDSPQCTSTPRESVDAVNTSAGKESSSKDVTKTPKDKREENLNKSNNSSSNEVGKLYY